MSKNPIVTKRHTQCQGEQVAACPSHDHLHNAGHDPLDPASVHVLYLLYLVADHPRPLVVAEDCNLHQYLSESHAVMIIINSIEIMSYFCEVESILSTTY